MDWCFISPSCVAVQLILLPSHASLTSLQVLFLKWLSGKLSACVLLRVCFLMNPDEDTDNCIQTTNHLALLDWSLNMNVFLQLAFLCAFFHLISYYWDSSILIHIIFHLFSLLYSTQRTCILQFIYYFFYWWIFGCFHFYFAIINNDPRSIFVPVFWCT